MPTLIQLIIVARFDDTKKVLTRIGRTPFPLPVECAPTHEQDMDMWVEDVHDAVNMELGRRVGFKIMSECKNTPLLRHYTRKRTEVFAFKANFHSEDIGIDPEKTSVFTWSTAKDIREMNFGEESDRVTLLLALSQ
ncbi:MAG: hypothetical protein WCS89_03695 [Candidatus Paceibacterota bacterium]